MKRAYVAPSLVEYGRLDQITLGSGGTLPDLVSGQVVNNNCGTQTFTGTSMGSTLTFTRSACLAS